MSKSGSILFVGAVIVAGGMFATKPTNAQVENQISELIVADIQATGASDLLGDIMLFTCQSNINECTQLIRFAMNVQIEDQLLWQKVMIRATDLDLNCLALLNQLYCPGFLNKA